MSGGSGRSMQAAGRPETYWDYWPYNHGWKAQWPSRELRHRGRLNHADTNGCIIVLWAIGRAAYVSCCRPTRVIWGITKWPADSVSSAYRHIYPLMSGMWLCPEIQLIQCFYEKNGSGILKYRCEIEGKSLNDFCDEFLHPRIQEKVIFIYNLYECWTLVWPLRVFSAEIDRFGLYMEPLYQVPYPLRFLTPSDSLTA